MQGMDRAQIDKIFARNAIVNCYSSAINFIQDQCSRLESKMNSRFRLSVSISVKQSGGIYARN